MAILLGFFDEFCRDAELNTRSTRSSAAEIALEGTCVVVSGGMWELYSRVAIDNSRDKVFRVDIFTSQSIVIVLDSCYYFTLC